MHRTAAGCDGGGGGGTTTLLSTNDETADERHRINIKNTHPTHTKVGGWGLWPMIVP